VSVEVAHRFSNTIFIFRYKYFRQVSNQCAIDDLSIEFMLYGIVIVNFNYILLEGFIFYFLEKASYATKNVGSL